MPRALVIDDSAAVRGIVVSLLDEHGWTTEACASAEEGAARALSEPFDVVVSDLWMPGTSGLQMTRLLRNDPFTADLPVVLLTASSDRRTRFWAQLSGADFFLEKRCIRELPQLLAKLEPRPLAARTPAKAVDPQRIPARLGHLLDEALFDCELASRVRGLALEHADVESLFRGLADLMSSIVAYRWLALSVVSDGQSSVYVHCNGLDRLGLDQATHAVGHGGRFKEIVVSDDRCVSIPRAPSPHIEHVITHANAEVGRFAIALAEPDQRGQDAAIFGLVAREIAMPLRLSGLLEFTRRRALTDELTSLTNRRGGDEALLRAVAGAQRQHQPFSVVIADIDRFKLVNDTYGHGAGDVTLRHVARILEKCARRSDMVVRWGGEEFLVLLPATAGVGARTLAERLRQVVAMAPVTLENGKKIEVTISAGVATLDAESAAALVERADRALYVAKNSGRNRVEVAEDARNHALVHPANPMARMTPTRLPAPRAARTTAG